MAKASTLKKLFSSYKQMDGDSFYKAASEIIEDERKNHHEILANDLSMILNENGQLKSNMETLSVNIPKDDDKKIPLVDIVYPEKYFPDLIIPKEKTNQIKEIIREFSNWDILVSNGVFPTRRVLFYGPPGCGKTLAAQVISGELGLPLMYVRFDALISSYLGETAENIRKVFDYAKNGSWVIFFDEFDAIARSRNDETEHGEIKRVVNTFLQQIDNYKGRSLIIAATNFEQSLDYAIWRRFDETIRFDMPSSEEKVKLFNKNMGVFKGPSYAFESYINETTSFSHSDIEKVCQTIMKNCILDGRKIYSKKDIEYAVKKQAQIVSLRKTRY